MFEKDAEEYARNTYEMCSYSGLPYASDRRAREQSFKDGAEFGYNKCKEEHEGKCKTAYIKGIRTMANALKDYDRTEGAWTDYFEHKVDEVLKRLLKEK